MNSGTNSSFAVVQWTYVIHVDIIVDISFDSICILLFILSEAAIRKVTGDITSGLPIKCFHELHILQ
jgi:hypothetical protein